MGDTCMDDTTCMGDDALWYTPADVARLQQHPQVAKMIDKAATRQKEMEKRAEEEGEKRATQKRKQAMAVQYLARWRRATFGRTTHILLMKRELEQAMSRLKDDRATAIVSGRRLQDHRRCEESAKLECVKISCPFKCPAGTPRKIMHRNMEEHQKTCNRRPTPCQHCRQGCPFEKLRTHEKTCGKRLVKCRHCSQTMELKYREEHEASHAVCQHCGKTFESAYMLSLHEYQCAQRPDSNEDSDEDSNEASVQGGGECERKSDEHYRSQNRTQVSALTSEALSSFTPSHSETRAPARMEEWDEQQVRDFVSNIGKSKAWQEIAESLYGKRIDGAALAILDDGMLIKMGFEEFWATMLVKQVKRKLGLQDARNPMLERALAPRAESVASTALTTMSASRDELRRCRRVCESWLNRYNISNANTLNDRIRKITAASCPQLHYTNQRGVRTPVPPEVVVAALHELREAGNLSAHELTLYASYAAGDTEPKVIVILQSLNLLGIPPEEVFKSKSIAEKMAMSRPPRPQNRLVRLLHKFKIPMC